MIESWRSFLEGVPPDLLSVVFVLLRAVVIVIPPLQGWMVDILGIELFGPWKAFVLSELGVCLGAGVAFGVARSARGVVERHAQIVVRFNDWQARFKPRQQLLVWTGLRVATNPLFDYVSYAAGLSRVSFALFMGATLLGSAPSMLLFFFAYERTRGAGLGIVLAAVGVMLVFLAVMSRWAVRRMDLPRE